MLKKLLKYEFKNGYLFIFIPCIASLILSIGLSYLLKMEYIFTMTWSILVLFSLIVSIIVFTFYVCFRSLWSTMYGRTGPLTFSLPVSPTQLLLSKIIMNFVWVTISVLSILGVIAISFTGTLGLFEELSITNGWVLFFLVIFLFTAYVLFYINLIMFIAAVVNTSAFKKYRIFYVILFWYIVDIPINLAKSLITIVPFSVVINPSPLSWSIEYTGFMYIIDAMMGDVTYVQLFSLNDIFLFLAGAIGLFFATKSIITKKLSF